MLDEQINEQLSLLEKELSRLKSTTDYIDKVNVRSSNIIDELATIQSNFGNYTNSLFSLFEQNTEDLKRNAELHILTGVQKFEDIGSGIENSFKDNLLDTTKLLKQFKHTVDTATQLTSALESFDFEQRLADIEKLIQDVNISVTRLENTIIENHTMLLQRLDKQDTLLTGLKTMLYVICGLLFLGFVLIYLK